MTDKQAKHVAIEAAWCICLKGKRFPVAHGTPDLDECFVQIRSNLNQAYEENVARVFNEVLVRELSRCMRRSRYLKLAFVALTVAVLIILFSSKF